MQSADSLNRQGVELYLQGDNEGAQLHYLAALRSDPGWLPSLANLISILSQQNDLLPALSFCRKILALVPDDGDQWNTLGNLLTRLERYDEAEPALLRATELMPDNRSTWHNLALYYHRTGAYEKALESIEKTKALGGLSHQLENDEAHMLLCMGDLDLALPAYETRWWDLQHLPPWDYHIPEWKGENLEGKRLLLHAEQGFGDTIMTSRFALDLTRIGAEVTLGLPLDLCSLFDAQDWVHKTLAIEDMDGLNMQGFDFQSPMYSAMRWLGIKQCSIRPEPYLKAPEITVPKVFSNQFNVGICWKSGKRNSRMEWRRRVTDLGIWFPLSEVPNVQLWSLYKGPDEDRELNSIGAKALIQDRMDLFNFWAETSAFVDQLDLIITVDTGIAHLSAAMGKPTIMLSQYAHCWRWWDFDHGTGKPWYDCMKIVPQVRPQDWQTQITIAKHLLENAVQGWTYRKNKDEAV